MANYFTLNELKAQLNIETSFIADDTYLSGLTTVVTTSVQNYCNYGLTGYTTTTNGVTVVPAPVKQAAIMLAAHLYINRTLVSFAQGVEIPYSFKFLLDPYKNFVAV